MRRTSEAAHRLTGVTGDQQHHKEALRILGVALRFHRAGDLRRAVYHYRRSIELAPTAEAYTFLGWAYSFQGDLERAVAECRRAIGIDPSLGNPYNDIGAYLIELGRVEEAVAWLERALEAPRYESYCYPHYHLGRAMEQLGRRGEAIRSYGRALQEDPSFIPARLALTKLKKSV
jgi:Tfp pilus assembly protein PilF